MSLLVLALCLQQATLHAEPVQVQVGQPVTWTLVVEHDVDEAVDLESLAQPSDDTWVLLSGPEVARVRDGERASTRIQWSLFSLEAGDRALPGLEVSLSSGLKLTALAGNLEVIGDLGPAEDAPRPLGGPIAPPTEATSSAAGLWYLALLPLILAGAYFLRRGRAEPQVSNPVPPVDLAALLAGSADSGDFAAALSGRIRASIDTEQCVPRQGMIDEDWIQDVRARGGIDLVVIDEAQQLLTWADTLEFGQVQPSKMALSDALERVEALLARAQTAEAVA
jgi:hypothetical protein